MILFLIIALMPFVGLGLVFLIAETFIHEDKISDIEKYQNEYKQRG